MNAEAFPLIPFRSCRPKPSASARQSSPSKTDARGPQSMFQFCRCSVPIKRNQLAVHFDSAIRLAKPRSGLASALAPLHAFPIL